MCGLQDLTNEIYKCGVPIQMWCSYGLLMNVISSSLKLLLHCYKFKGYYFLLCHIAYLFGGKKY